jgi:hypothetical protein
MSTSNCGEGKESVDQSVSLETSHQVKYLQCFWGLTLVKPRLRDTLYVEVDQNLDLVILDQNLVDLTGGGPVHLYPLLLMRRGMVRCLETGQLLCTKLY